MLEELPDLFIPIAVILWLIGMTVLAPHGPAIKVGVLATYASLRALKAIVSSARSRRA